MASPVAYWVSVAIGALVCLVACVAARRRPGPWMLWFSRALALVLALDAVVFMATPVVDGYWSVAASLPLALCDVALVVAAVACWWPTWQLGVELTYFWGLAGTLQAVITPDLSVSFPHLEFFEFVVGHLSIVIAALFLVVGMRLEPRPGAVPRVFGITVAYTAFVAVFDWATGANYMFLAHRPAHTSLLDVLGPWPWYVLTAAIIAYVLLLLLDAPFQVRRSRAGAKEPAQPA